MVDQDKTAAKVGIVQELLLCRSVYSMAFDVAMKIFELSHKMPHGGNESLHHKIIKYSSAVCESLTAAWQKRDTREAFIDKLNDAAISASETQNQIENAEKDGILTQKQARKLFSQYESIIDKITGMIKQPGTSG